MARLVQQGWQLWSALAWCSPSSTGVPHGMNALVIWRPARYYNIGIVGAVHGAPSSQPLAHLGCIRRCCWYHQYSTRRLAQYTLRNTTHQEACDPMTSVCPNDDELHLFCRSPTHDGSCWFACDNEALVNQIRGVGLLHKRGETLVGLRVQGF